MMTLVSEKDEFYHDIDQLDDYSNEKIGPHLSLRMT